MKIGAEDKKKVIWMTVLLAIAIPFGLYSFRDMLWSGGSPAVATPAPPPGAGPQKAGSAVIAGDSDPRLRLDILIDSQKIKYEPGRNIFEMQAAPIEPVVAGVRENPNVHYGPDLPPPPPPPPPIPLKFYGFASKPGETKKIFLQQQNGEHMFVATQGEVIDRRYKVIQIQANAVVMEDMLTNNRQPIPLTPR